MSEAIDLDVPVVIAVAAALFGDWLAAANGLAVKVKPTLPALDEWWLSLRRSPSAVNAGDSVCALLK